MPTIKINFLVVSFCLVFLGAGLARAGTPSLEEIVTHADEARGPSGDISFRVQVKDFDGSSLLRTNIYHVYSKAGKQVLIETEFPERMQGRKLLMRDDDLWL